ncbi:MAG: carbohydrate kinase family protein [Phycisphaerae bacterium]|nr:carbohydrate kinase family protein [Phycisphaerae bacterium]
MGVDILLLNTAVADFRDQAFAFTDELVGPGGLAKCRTEHMPDYTQQQYKAWIDQGKATAGGPGNTAPLIARAGLDVAVGVNLGRGDCDGMDVQGQFFYRTMEANGIDMSPTYIHPTLPTGTTFIYEKDTVDRGGIAYFPNANNDFDFDYFKAQVTRLTPKIVYYMYSGLSDRGDAHGGQDLAAFVRWCVAQGAITIVDSHTLTGNPHALIESDAAVPEYALLQPLLSELDIFFTSYDEARMIENTLGQKGMSRGKTEDAYIRHFLDFLVRQSGSGGHRTRLFGVTVSSGAYHTHVAPDGTQAEVHPVRSKFMAGEVIDLVGAGDSFRAGLITYIARNIEAFKQGRLNVDQAVHMGNLFASLFIKAPLDDRYGHIKTYDTLLRAVTADRTYRNFDELIHMIS